MKIAACCFNSQFLRSYGPITISFPEASFFGPKNHPDMVPTVHGPHTHKDAALLIMIGTHPDDPWDQNELG